MEGMGTIPYETAAINVELLTTKIMETGRHCDTFIADEYDDGHASNGD